jgi:hypothetical protein
MFIRAYLSGDDTYGACVDDPRRGAPIEDIRAAYKTALLRAHAEDMVALAMEKGIELPLEEALRRIPHRLTKMRAHSFYRYFHHLKMLGWVEPTGEEEGSLFGGVPGARVEATPEGTTLVEIPQPRRFYRLTAKGKEAADVAWSDPLQALYEYPPEYRHKKAERLYRPGSLPRTIKPKRRLK